MKEVAEEEEQRERLAAVPNLKRPCGALGLHGLQER
jgi:hypothetical protein